MRVANWRGKEVFGQISAQALDNANSVMDIVVEGAKALCPVGHIYRPPGFRSGTVDFWTKNKKYYNRNLPWSMRMKHVKFTTDKIWVGREPGSLKKTIRRVNSARRPKNIRAYAGNFKIFYARFVEMGTVKMAAKPYLRPAFNAIKGRAIAIIKSGA